MTHSSRALRGKGRIWHKECGSELIRFIFYVGVIASFTVQKQMPELMSGGELQPYADDATLAHEVGHAIWFRDLTWVEQKQWFALHATNPSLVAVQVYADDPRHSFAEAFAEFICDPENDGRTAPDRLHLVRRHHRSARYRAASGLDGLSVMDEHYYAFAYALDAPEARLWRFNPGRSVVLPIFVRPVDGQ